MKRPKIEDYKTLLGENGKGGYWEALEKYADWLENTKYRDKMSYVKDKESFILVTNKQEQQIKELKECDRDGCDNEADTHICGNCFNHELWEYNQDN